MSAPSRQSRLTDWFRQWRGPLRRFLSARSGLRAADIDDVAQEVFLRLMRYERAELVEHPQAYLFRVATNVAAEWAVRARYSRPHEPKWLAALRAHDQPDENAERKEALAEIERALNTLTPRQREILALHYSEGMGRAEIAERLATTPRSVKRDLINSYGKLRAQLSTELLGALNHGRD